MRLIRIDEVRMEGEGAISLIWVESLSDYSKKEGEEKQNDISGKNVGGGAW